MPEPKAQLIDPQGPIDVPGLSVTGVTTATGGFVGAVQGAATGFAATTYNLNVGIVTATKFSGNTTGNVSGLADDTNINVGIITSTSFTGDLVGNAAGLSTTTANINAGIMSATSFAGNFTGVASGITGTPNIVVGIMTGTLKGDGSSLTGIAATNWITNNVTANSSTTTVNLSLGNVVIFTQSADTTVSFANTGTSNIVSFIRKKDASGTARELTWPSSINWNGGSAPTLVTDWQSGDVNVITLLTRDEGVTWYGWETVSVDEDIYELWGWGRNYYGSLGLNNGVKYSSPVQIPGEWKSVKQTYSSTHAFKTDGTLWSWGYNTWGQLGLTNSTTDYSSPVQVTGTDWALVADTGRHVFGATKTDGTLWMSGRNNEAGNLGLNDTTERSSPTQVPGTTWSTSGNTLAGNENCIYAIKTDGTLWTFGNNGNGQLGLNDATQRSSPVQIPGTWSEVFNPNDNTRMAALRTDGTLWMWGSQPQGQFGVNNRTQYSSPIQLPGTTWKKVEFGDDCVAGVKTDGTFWTWGNDKDGSGGRGPSDNAARSSPTQVPGTTWNDFGIYAQIVANKTDGTLWAWGGNNNGQLAQNNTTQYESPVQIPGTDWNGSISIGIDTPLATKKSY